MILILSLEPGSPEFSDRAIGITVLKNVDPWHRNAVYCLAIISGLSFSTALFLSLAPRLFGRTTQTPAWSLPWSTDVFWLLVCCALLNLLAAAVSGESLPWLPAAALALVLCSLSAVSRILHSQRDDQLELFFGDFCLTWQAGTALCQLFQVQPGVPFWLLWLISWAGLQYARRLAQNGVELAPLRLLLAAPTQILVLAMPLLIVVARELAYIASLRGLPWLTSAWAGIGLAGLLIGVAALRGQRYRAGPALAGFCVLLTTVVVNEYAGTIVYRDSYDLFHLGERILPLQQWQSFGLLPFIDYLPVHGLFDLFPHLLYQQLSGASPFEALLWGNGYFLGWLMRALAAGLVWWFLLRLLSPVPAFFLVWLLPTYHIFEPYHALLLLPAIHILALPRTGDHAGWWLRQWLLCLLVLAWRLDFGLALLLGNLSLAIALSWYRAGVRSFATCVAMALTVGLATLMLWLWASDGTTVSNNLAVLFAYIIHQAPLGSYESFYTQVDYATLMQYVVLPGLTVFIAASSLSSVLRRQTEQGAVRLDLLLIFLAAVSLCLSLRGLQRHSLLEGVFQNYLYLVVMLVFLLRQLAPRIGGAGLGMSLAVFVMATYLLLPKGDNRLFLAFYRHQPQWEYPMVATPWRWPDSEVNTSRLQDSVVRYEALSKFLRKNLKPGQSFYDFANAPLLYALVDAPLPAYIMETVYHSSDTLQEHVRGQLEEWLRAGKLPLVVFRQNNRWDSSDGVDNALRSFRMAEFIYKAYQPCVRVSGFDVWLERSLSKDQRCRTGPEVKQLAPDYLEQHIDFQLLPLVWAASEGRPEALSKVQPLTTHRSSSSHWSLSEPTSISCGGNACYLDVELDSPTEQVVQLSFQQREQLSFRVVAGRHHYRLRLSVLWHWYRAEEVSAIELKADSELDVINAELHILAGS